MVFRVFFCESHLSDIYTNDLISTEKTSWTEQVQDVSIVSPYVYTPKGHSHTTTQVAVNKDAEGDLAPPSTTTTVFDVVYTQAVVVVEERIWP